MLRKPITGGIILLFLLVSLFPMVSSNSSPYNNTTYVDDDNTEGPWDGTQEHPYRYIQDAVNTVSDGDTVFVYSGMYYENIIVDKSISLIGEDKYTTIIDGGRADIVVQIFSHSSEIKRFTIQNSTHCTGYEFGIKIKNGHGITISENIIQCNKIGISCDSKNNTFSNNIFKNNDYGIRSYYLSNENDVICENLFIGNGMCIFCSKCDIIDNILNDNGGFGLSYNGGIWTSKSKILRNIISNSTGVSIWAYNCSIVGNNVTNNREGIRVQRNNNYISNNFISNNNKYGIRILESSNNVISGNNIQYNDGDGIKISSTSFNNSVDGNSIVGNKENGISLSYYCENNIVSNNYLNDNVGNGIYVKQSSENSICSNQITKNMKHGIYLDSSSSHIITDNDLNLNDIYIDGNYLSYWSSHTIEGNYLNGRPILYYKNNHTGGLVPSNTGQIILVDCQNFTLQYLNITNVGRGIDLIFSSNNTISSSKLENNTVGIYLLNSKDNTITKNTVSNNSEFGIHLLSESDRNHITYNTIQNNEQGIYQVSSSENVIQGNQIIGNNKIGLYIRDSISNLITQNIISNNKDEGIYLIVTSNNKIDMNNITGNKRGILLSYSFNNSISGNIIMKNQKEGIILVETSYNNISRNTISKNHDDGIYLKDSFHNSFIQNNFVFNKGNVFFIDSKNNIWNANYWNRIRYLPYPIFGYSNYTLTLVFDRHPAKEPYDTGGNNI